ncbi:LPXTG cell wall anchor domain-containing protein [Ruania halotolerans]|uniref:LPXTG cell wall anchor domain-containing protein n=1 Tax=Ruania halotolerans TaxID=2897773 RepID=UPI001E5174A2|nr:LPXTG cell wall anchor domain-containing protein [Ruania halotolerans]UFU07360.1 LPXTG cell wall anchor domain-containing protein [Ruania halotolerans]
MLIAAGATHTYEVEVVIGLAEGTEGAPVITDCQAIPTEGDGLTNTAEIEHNDLTADDSVCVTPGVVSVEKTVSSGPTPNGDGTWTVVYDIVATHLGGAAADYDVTDRLHYGADIEIVDKGIVTAPDGVQINGSWTGLGAEDSDPENLVASGVTLDVGGMHTYQVEVTVQMEEATIDLVNLECAAAGSGEAGGLANSTTLTSNGIVSEDEVCPTVTVIELDKELVEGSPVENGDGTWTIEYDVTATNAGPVAGDYDLSDRLRYGAGIEVESASIVSGPEGVEPNAGWSGQGAEGAAENVIVAGQSLEIDEQHVFRVRVVASMDRDVVTPGDLECPEPGSNEPGGFANTAELTHNGEDQSDVACEEPPLIDIAKSLSGAVTPVDGEPGVYDAIYELTVTNTGAGAGVYDLDDELAPGAGVSVVGIQDVTSDAPDAVAINDAFDGVDQTRIVTDQPIAGATDDVPVVHTYMVTVRYAADLTTVDVPAGRACTTAGGEPEPGTLGNTATVDWNGLQDSAVECLVPGDPTLDKELVSATPIGNGQWEVVYDLTVANTGNEATTYDLEDELLFAPQITVDTVSVTGPEGITVNDGFDGAGDQVIATGIEIIGLDEDGYAPHVYTVTVVANVPLSFEEADVAADGTGSPACTTPAGGNFTEQGLNNAATLTNESGGTIVDTDCGYVPSTTITKTMDGDPVAGADGQWTVNYLITVVNDGAANGSYTLTDQLRYGAGIDVLDATITDAPEGVTPAQTWTGTGGTGAVENTIAADVDLAVGQTHTYRVSIDAHLDTDAADESTLECPAPGSTERGGFSNTAGLDHNDLSAEASTCAVPEWPEEVPPPLPQTGTPITQTALAAALLLLIAGGILMHHRRRTTAA